jgi:hypothetical protein
MPVLRHGQPHRPRWFGAATAIARWTGQGKHIVYCLATSGEASIDTMAPEQARRAREAEQTSLDIE